VLADLELPQPTDEPGTQHETEYQSGKGGARRSKRDIAKDIEDEILRVERIE
jgi:hypothetical protein